MFFDVGVAFIGQSNIFSSFRQKTIRGEPLKRNFGRFEICQTNNYYKQKKSCLWNENSHWNSCDEESLRYVRNWNWAFEITVFNFIAVDSPFTRLTAPFPLEIWLMIGGTLAAAIAMILLTKTLSRKWRHFYIGGRLNRTPILNMWMTVLGSPVCNPRMTNRRSFGTFARTLLMLWILLWFVLRNSYQGSLYNFLQRHRFSSVYDTIEKIYEADCKILIPLFTSRIMQVNTSSRWGKCE